MKKIQFNNRSKHSSSPLRKRVGLVLLSVLILGGTLTALDAANILDIPGFRDKQPDTTGEGIDYGPPTEQEKKETEAFKDRQASETPVAAPAAPGQKKSVTPVITSWGQNPNNQALEASGFVSGIIESGGTCTLTASKDDRRVSESVPATPNAQNVSCGLITIPRSKLSAGNWSLSLSYMSATAEGTSQAQQQGVE